MHNTLSIILEKEIPFYDVDSYQIVWHGNYPKYFEEARCALFEELGCSYDVMQQWGYFFPVIDINIRYVKPLLFKQKVLISAQLKQWQNKLVIKYLITDGVTGEQHTKASSTQVAVSMPEQITQYESPAPLIDLINSITEK